ncbi:YciI family protein [Tessaracoccus sp. OH4464_COT-324]|uniref:YciI family protein n=1 Tax=Tessaracoccus sp. OH4464_COT-324 TaxID=2491059 RepID=UPI000F62D9A4|nr:YciI family protein [Tessaracoccus sp. OH4464_COT-324]RRD45636.1 hypothetical protein EII42_10675 [Tessaracoccus sp. OH4464_COT-324]
MSYFAVHYTYSTDQARLDEVRPQHRAFLGQQPNLVASGPLLGTSPGRALLVFRAQSADDLAAQLDQDPFRVAGLIVEREILGWHPVLGVFADDAAS